jgi:hypothetical protein
MLVLARFVLNLYMWGIMVMSVCVIFAVIEVLRMCRGTGSLWSSVHLPARGCRLRSRHCFEARFQVHDGLREGQEGLG